MTRDPAFLSVFVLAVILQLSVRMGSAAELYLKNDQIYKLAAMGEGDGAVLLEEIRSSNPGLSLTALTRDGSSIKLHHSSGQVLEVLGNELYSLAVYVPQGIESGISRRSGEFFRIGRILREDDGIRFYFGSPPGSGIRGLADILTEPGGKRGAAPPSISGARSRVVLHQAGPTGSIFVKTPPEGSALNVADSFTPSAVEAREVPHREVENRSVEPEFPDVTAVDLPGKVSADRLPAPSGSPLAVRFNEQAARQPRVAPLSERVSGVGAVPRKAGRKEHRTHSRELTAGKLSEDPPVIDGRDGDAAWAGAGRSAFPIPGQDLRVEAAAVADGENLYLLLSWRKDDPSRSHRPWIWNKGEGIYERGERLDDGVAVRWQMNRARGDTRKAFDLWMWRAGREGEGSNASDMMLLMDERPFYMATNVRDKNEEHWVRLDFDRGRLPFEIVLPSSFSGPEVASYAPSVPDGSASDVKSAGGWNNGQWVVEMARALRTGNVDDVPFSTEGNCAFVVNLLQGKDLKESPASEVLTLSW